MYNTSSPKIKVTARYIETRWQSETNQSMICIYTVDMNDMPEQFHIEGKRRLRISVMGENLPTVRKNDIVLEGTVTKDRYGLKMEQPLIEVLPPSTDEAMTEYMKYLGCSERTASKIVNHFGKESLNIIENEPERLHEIKGMRRKTVEQLVYNFNDMTLNRNAELAKLLKPFNIGAKRIRAIANHFGKRNKNVVEMIKEDPFILMNVKGFGFYTLNEIGRTYGVDPRNPNRIECGVKQILYEAQRDGHLFLPQKELIYKATVLLNKGIHTSKIIDFKMVIDIMVEMKNHLRLFGDNGNAYLVHNYDYEVKVANVVNRLLHTKTEIRDVSRYIDIVEMKLGFNLSQKQRLAVQMVCNNALSIVIGSAGTGKSTALRGTLQTLYKLGYKEDDVIFAAPTGKAAQRMKECTGHDAVTLHSLLNLRADDDFVKDEDPYEQLDCKLLVVDEYSMADMFITYKLFSAIDTEKTKVLLVGDPEQLPSVGAGNVLAEFIASKKIPVTELDVIYRQSSENLIVANSHKIRHGDQRIAFNEDFAIIEETRATRAAEIVIDKYFQLINQYGIENVQVLSPTRQNGDCCTNELNRKIQNIINPPVEGKLELAIGDFVFREKDRVIQNKNITKTLCTNDDEPGEKVFICNGDTGKILSITRNENRNIRVKIDFGYGRIVMFEREDMYDIGLSYALTVHKVQGSEYKHVIMPMIQDFGPMLYRNLLYTGVTRAKQGITIVGTANTLHQCIRKSNTDKRNTQLAYRIIKAVDKEDAA